MSTVVDVSGVLGEYMLKGWILTDIICKKCSKVPLLRSKASPPHAFCANCDGGPVPTNSPTSAELSQHSSSSEASISQSASRPSTPPTEISSTLSSPTFAPPVDMEEITRRRQQSDLASTEIGKLLLKGWAMLADECPNVNCYGVPLVRPPRINGEQNPRKECVVCHTVYVDRPGGGLERLEPPSSLPARDNSSQVVEATPSSSVPAVGRALSSDRSPNASTIRIIPDKPGSPDTPNSTVRTLQATADALERSLTGLSGKLDYLSSGQAFDAQLIGQTADAISKVTHALIKVKELQWSERQASES